MLGKSESKVATPSNGARPNNSHLKNVVIICDPQIVFSSISELIFDIYDPRNNILCTSQKHIMTILFERDAFHLKRSSP